MTGRRDESSEATSEGASERSGVDSAEISGESDRSESVIDEPLGGLARRVDERRDRSGEEDDLFDLEAVEEIDSERLWEQIERDDVEVNRESVVRDVPKREYCHQCEYFDEPPSVGCTHDGTVILEMPALETFRVADCPVVHEDEALEKER